jgi:ADP-heptose:LPS heptosyltransferase
MHKSKYLLLRLSSLGDVILASTALEMQTNLQIDWVVAQEFSSVLKGHPKISDLIEFDRKSGLRGWVRLCKVLWTHQYTHIFDLHRSLRTRLMRLLFTTWSILERRTRPQWKTVSKEKLQLFGYFLFKKIWPKKLRPSPWATRYLKLLALDIPLAEGSGEPRLSYLLKNTEFPQDLRQVLPDDKTYLCVMPSSQWNSKNWPVGRYVEVLKKLPYFPVILGTQKDAASFELCKSLEEHQIAHFSGVGKWNLNETAHVITSARVFLGGDTGLAHLAEGLGVPTHVIFGPTTPEMGFGPRLKESRAIGASLWCRPCSINGSVCYRPVRKQLCLQSLEPTQVVAALFEQEHSIGGMKE